MAMVLAIPSLNCTEFLWHIKYLVRSNIFYRNNQTALQGSLSKCLARPNTLCVKRNGIGKVNTMSVSYTYEK